MYSNFDAYVRVRVRVRVGVEFGRVASRIPKFLVIGHRGNGMNALQSTDDRMRAIKENSILSFNTAAKFPLDFVEFDVQVRACLLLLLHFHFSSGGLFRYLLRSVILFCIPVVAASGFVLICPYVRFEFHVVSAVSFRVFQ